MEAHLSNHHRTTLERLLGHPASGNVEWRQVLSLFEAIGTVTTQHNGKVRLEVGSETVVLQPPRGKDVDAEAVAELHRLLRHAGFAA